MPKIIRSKELKEQETTTPLSLSHIETEANNIINHAKKQSAELIEKTKTYLLSLKNEVEKKTYQETFEKAYKEGKSKGYVEGFESAKQNFLKESDFIISSLENIIKTLSKEKLALTYNIHKDLLKLALAIAEKIVKQKITIDENVIYNNLVKAIELTAKRNEIEIRINPEDEKLIADILPDIKRSITDLEVVKIVADDSVHRGGCVVLTREGSVDADIKTQINEIARILGL